MDWEAWISGHARPEAARRVFDWLTKSDAEETVWQAREQLVALVAEVVEDCAKHVERFEGTDFDMRDKFQGPK